MLSFNRTKSHFFESACTTSSPVGTTEDLKLWLEERKQSSSFRVRKVPFEQLEKWHFDGNAFSHESGRFFSIEGIEVETDFPEERNFSQPIINQPEVGILGFLVREISGVPHFLVQAKFEPGNVNLVQLSPTVQATKSNYSQVHQGRRPRYLEYFLSYPGRKTLVDQLQTEQGAFFYRKRNRNMVVQADGDIPLHEDFHWATLGQLNELLRENNLVNMDARTILSCLSFFDEPDSISSLFSTAAPGPGDEEVFRCELLDSLVGGGQALHTTLELISWFTELKTRCDIVSRRVPLKRLSGWITSAESIVREGRDYFAVYGLAVEASSREITGWTQPIIAPCEQGVAAFVVQRFNDVLHFLVQAKLQPGSFDMVELAPTVQYIPGEPGSEVEEKIPFFRYVIAADSQRVRHDSVQSEEGGRFYHYQNRNLVVQAADSEQLDLPRNYTWMTLRQIKEFIVHSHFNIEARGLLACLGLAL